MSDGLTRQAFLEAYVRLIEWMVELENDNMLVHMTSVVDILDGASAGDGWFVRTTTTQQAWSTAGGVGTPTLEQLRSLK